MPNKKIASQRNKRGRFGSHDDLLGESSNPTMVSGRTLRPRSQKRAAEADPEVYEEERNESADDVEDSEDEDYHVQPREGKGLASASDSDDDEEDVEEEDDAIMINPEIQKPSHPITIKVVNYVESGNASLERKNRRESPLNVERTATDYRFHTLF
ncbi:hypothetical protein BAE44_0006458 [Dichanthelium oligosanthes]|uniref:Uncharacterized protein n=1 Tax=Dichanthelium oligosanthes TaxID=888268 RepID=A0A1E5W532_9POAL|nr:hypothetical protein BAE44_0006458 [Dichanthelium oligosanthes]